MRNFIREWHTLVALAQDTSTFQGQEAAKLLTEFYVLLNETMQIATKKIPAQNNVDNQKKKK